MPPTTASSSNGKLSKNVNLSGVTVPSDPPYSAPPTPAIAADSENTSNFVARMFMPNIAQAAGLSLIASRRSPKELRRMATTTRAQRQKTTASTTSSAFSLDGSTKGTCSRATGTDPTSKSFTSIGPMLNLGRLNSQLSSTTANAPVASAR